MSAPTMKSPAVEQQAETRNNKAAPTKFDGLKRIPIVRLNSRCGMNERKPRVAFNQGFRSLIAARMSGACCPNGSFPSDGLGGEWSCEWDGERVQGEAWNVWPEIAEKLSRDWSDECGAGRPGGSKRNGSVA